MVGVDIDIFVDRAFVDCVSIRRESNNASFVSVDLLFGLGIGIDEAEISTQFAYRADNDSCGFNNGPANGLDEMGELEVKDLIEWGSFFLDIFWDSQDVSVISD